MNGTSIIPNYHRTWRKLNLVRYLAAVATTIVFHVSSYMCVTIAFQDLTPIRRSVGTFYMSKTSSISLSDASRMKRIPSLTEWAKAVGIKVSGVTVSKSENSEIGLGLKAIDELKGDHLLIQVPPRLALSVTTSGDGEDDASVAINQSERRKYRETTWWARLSLQLNALDKVSPLKELNRSDSVDMSPWLNSLPRKFHTPIHWSIPNRQQMQYQHLVDAVSIQEQTWKAEYDKLMDIVSSSSPLKLKMRFDDFVWGCECARSRAFSGAYSGNAFNPAPYAFTLLLVTVYISLHLGSIEQAANGAGLVFCGSIIKDFVLPKLSKSRRFVICPLIDMANHVGLGQAGEVSFEYFGNCYSLAVSKNQSISKGSEVFISYGPRSNDQLLQYYGFVEKNNPHDVYVMPPLRDWDISALEEVCGVRFNPGRLQKLDRAGLLGRSGSPQEVNSEDEGEVASRAGGVVLTRSGGIDPAVLTALRALVSTDEEWTNAGEALGSFVNDSSGGAANERRARLAAKAAIELELRSKPTTLEQDEEILRRINVGKGFLEEDQEKVAIEFRIEKKKLLIETLHRLDLYIKSQNEMKEER